MRSLKTIQIIILIIVCFLSGYALGTRKVELSWKDYHPILNVQSRLPASTQTLDMTLFNEIVSKVNSDYYDKSKVDTRKMLYGAISGMLGSLDDPYTSFFPPKQNDAFKTQMAGEFSGIGAELGTENNRIIVISPLDSSPAMKAGIKSGDAILKVNDDDTTGWTLAQAVDKIRGPKGTPINLTIQHEKEKTAKVVKVVRDTIKIDSVTSWVKPVTCDGTNCKPDPNCKGCASVAYLRISQFGDRTNDEWVSNTNKIVAEMKKNKNIKGVVLDLRNNPGGYLTDAVFIASEFIDSGVVVKQEDGAGQIMEMSVSRQGELLDTPLVVLINKGSASASEIVSGALRDHGRATLVGDNSFGKGTVQQAIDVDDGASIHLSVAKWLTPNGTWVHHKGLKPDVSVSFDQKKSEGQMLDNQLQTAISTLLKK